MEINIYPDLTVTVLAKCKSRKNAVFVIAAEPYGQLKAVLKISRGTTSYLNNELKWLKYLYSKGLQVPKLFFAGSGYLIMEYIHGLPLVEQLEIYEQNNQNPNELVIALSEWLVNFYQAVPPNHSLTDVNLRNFLWTGTQLFGIDFEECSEGSVEQDIARICAFIISYDPAYTKWKRSLITTFLQEFRARYPICSNQVQAEYDNYLPVLYARRKVSIPSEIRAYRLVVERR